MSTTILITFFLFLLFLDPREILYAEETVPEYACPEEFEHMEARFYSSPKLGGGNLTQGSLRYNWSPMRSSRLGFSYATETFNVVFADDTILLPNGSRFRVGAGLLLYVERNLTEGLERVEPGVSLIFGVE